MVSEDQGLAFAAARHAAESKRQYAFIKNTAEYGLRFIIGYLQDRVSKKFQYETKKSAKMFYYNLHKTYVYIMPEEEIAEEEVSKAYLELMDRYTDLFEMYYRKYERKIEKGYDQEYVDNAFVDLRNSYYTYCLIERIPCVVENITVDDIKKEYDKIQQKKAEKNDAER